VRHTSSFFSLAVNSSPRTIRVEVTDEGPGLPVVRTPRPTEPHGRGLQVVEMLSDKWGVEKLAGDKGKTVWFEVAKTDGGAPARP
jgi:serine/threonine-protein kinase RsbW